MAVDKIKSLISGTEFNLYRFEQGAKSPSAQAAPVDTFVKVDGKKLAGVERGMAGAAEVPMPSGFKGIGRFKNP
ncbi:MAG: hypothetical protein JXA24_06090 [Proteobacteria bacterium]|nr:hypothetical protein [Pseudomonadota bacterium]